MNMRRLLSFFTMVMMTLAAIAQTSTITMSGITYELYDATMTATIKDGGCSGIVYVDEKFRLGQRSYTVTAVADNGFMGNSSITEVMLPNTVKTIGASAFDGCTSLERINIPRNLESIGSDAFDRCEALRPIQLVQADPGSIPSDDDLQQAMTHWLSIRFGSASANPLYYAHRLTGTSEEDIITEVNIPESITEIYAWAFAGGQDITTVNFPSMSYEVKALSRAKSAADQEFKIGYGAFYGCEKLIISKLPASVKEIKPSTFEGCRSIVEFNVHEGIRAVGSRAFAGCIGLKDFFCLTSYVPEAQGDTFEDSSISSATLHIYSRLLDEFKEAEGWKDFGSFETVLSDEEKEELLATDFFAMTAVDGDVTIKMKSDYSSPPVFALQTSFDKLEWSAPIVLDRKISSYDNTIATIPAGKTLYIRHYGEKITSLANEANTWEFYMKSSDHGTIALSGNIMSLLDGECKSTELGKGAFDCLFHKCTLLTDAKDLKLPATTLAERCYGGMFFGCENLTTAPELPATTLATSCYKGMFSFCTKLTIAPELPATTLAESCYYEMFESCNNLTVAPELPATTLAKSCYRRMFYACNKLTVAPELPATSLAEECYYSMFDQCKSISALAIKAENYANAEMVENCLKYTKSPFTLTCPQALIDKKGIAQIKKDFGLGEEDIIEAYLTEEERAELLATDFLAVTAVSNDVDLISSHSSWEVLDAPSLKTVCLQASTDKLTWDAPIKLEEDKIYEIAKIAKGTKLYIRRYGDVDDSMQGWTLKSKSDESTMALSGNVMSLLDKECKSTKVGENAFFFLFGSIYKTGQVVSASELKLPALELSKYCYSGMFHGNIALEDTPELPATTLADYCYADMFAECSKLTSAPKLPALKLSEGCYNMMFFACYKFEEAPELPATTLAEYCYNMMFAYTHLTEAPELPATTLAEGCYNRMFSYCESLTKAPELPATTLATSCYRLMFSGCRRLTIAPELPATELADTCYNNMFSKCTSLVNVPLIAATSLKDFSMGRMFSDCSKLNNLTVRFDDYDNGDGKYYVSNCLASTKYPFTLYCPQVLIDKKGMDQIKKDFGLRLDDNIVALEVIESAILDDENHTAWLRHGTRGGKRNNGDDDPDSPGYRGHRLTFPGKITVDGEDYEVVGISPEAFEDLDGITEIVIDLPRVPDMAPDAFDNIDLSHITLYVPEELLDDYRNTLPWSRFPEIRPIHEHVTTPDGSEFLIDHGTNTAEMLSGGRHEDTPHAIIIPEYVEVDGVRYPITSVSPDVFADLTGIEEIYVLTPYVPYLDPHALDGLDLSHIVLYVPESLIDSYSQTEPWSRFPDIRPIEATAIQTPSLTDADLTGRTITGYYDLNGAAISSPRRGVNIIRYSDGSTRKVMVK